MRGRPGKVTPAPQFQHLENLTLEKGKGKEALLEVASLGVPGVQPGGEKGLLGGGDRTLGVPAGFADDLLLQPKLVGRFWPLPHSGPFVGFLGPGLHGPLRCRARTTESPQSATSLLPLLVLGL